MVDQEKYRCRVCGKGFRSEAGLRTHMKTDHPSRYYSIRIGIPLILIILIIVFFSVFVGLPSTSQQTSPTTTSSPSTILTETLKKAPDFTLTVYNPKTLNRVSLSDFKGKPVLLEFFSPTCYHCIRMLPTVEKIYEKYKDRMTFIIISVPDVKELEKVVEEYEPSPIILLDDSRFTVFRNYNVTGTPTFFILDDAHNLIYRFEGAMSEDVLTSAIEEVAR
ncbi:MAG: redoxin domain-containing protein [Aigarchaeota archaeon]|nr:redoxin domain-containing protein [Aigarchaeota archaeon]MCX8192558.1 redoxin domain-containing protein [Nitrososphaeria archaeon]MDW7985706.1 redoxin domain-containing protein [Nitrososphaerota archaeon]